MSDDTPAITKEERAKLSKWARVTKCDFIEVKPSTISAYEATLTKAEARVKELEEALRWAIAEINLSTHYDNDEQFESCMVRVRAALKGNE